MAKSERKVSGPSRKDILEMYRLMYLIRRFEQESINLYRLDKIRGYFHPYIGEEAIAVGACRAAKKDDYIVSTHRGHGHCIAKGADVRLMMAELFGRRSGYCAGRGGSMHIANVAEGNLGANGIVGGGMSIAVGAALASVVKGDGRVTICFFSDGAANNGIFHEALNLAALWSLPVVFVLENNFYAVSTPVGQAASVSELARRADAYNMPGRCIDGNSVMTVYNEVGRAIKRARAAKGPTLIEAQTWRHTGHHCNDPGKYRDPRDVEEWMAKDPIGLLESYIRKHRVAAKKELDKIRSGVETGVREAIEFAEASPEPEVEEFLAAVGEYSFEKE